MSKRKLPPELREYFSRLGKKGGAKGGHARAANMTKKERSDSARMAVQARWAKKKEKESEGKKITAVIRDTIDLA